MIFFANLPWTTYEFLFFFKVKNKSILLTFIEIIFYFFIFRFITYYFEIALIGNAHIQTWEFYFSLFCLFVVFSSPGFIYRVLWK